MTAHSSILTWRIPWTKEPDRLQSMGSQRVRHAEATSHKRNEGFLQARAAAPGALSTKSKGPRHRL